MTVPVHRQVTWSVVREKALAMGPWSWRLVKGCADGSYMNGRAASRQLHRRPDGTVYYAHA